MLNEIDISHAALSEEQFHHVSIAEDFPGLICPPHEMGLGLLKRFETDSFAETILK
jgi:hypothetical protein